MCVKSRVSLQKSKLSLKIAYKIEKSVENPDSNPYCVYVRLCCHSFIVIN